MFRTSNKISNNTNKNRTLKYKHTTNCSKMLGSLENKYASIDIKLPKLKTYRTIKQKKCKHNNNNSETTTQQIDISRKTQSKNITKQHTLETS